MSDNENTVRKWRIIFCTVVAAGCIAGGIITNELAWFYGILIIVFYLIYTSD